MTTEESPITSDFQYKKFLEYKSKFGASKNSQSITRATRSLPNHKFIRQQEKPNLYKCIDFYKDGGLQYSGYRISQKNSLYGISMNYNNTYKYIGEFWNDSQHGFGVFYVKKNQIDYEGFSMLGRYHGEGVKYNSYSGVIEEKGLFKNNVLDCDSGGCLYDEMGLKIYKGGFKNGQFWGNGVRWHSNGKFRERGVY